MSRSSDARALSLIKRVVGKDGGTVYIEKVGEQLLCASHYWSASAELVRPLFDLYGADVVPGTYEVYVHNKRIRRASDSSKKVAAVWERALLGEKTELTRVSIGGISACGVESGRILNVYASGPDSVLLREDYVNLFPTSSKLTQSTGRPLDVVSVVVGDETVGLIMPVRNSE